MRRIVGEGQGKSVERSVAVVMGAIELLREGAVEVEACTGEGGDGGAVAPVEGEESASLAGGGARDGGLLDEGDFGWRW